MIDDSKFGKQLFTVEGNDQMVVTPMGRNFLGQVECRVYLDLNDYGYSIFKNKWQPFDEEKLRVLTDDEVRRIDKLFKDLNQKTGVFDQDELRMLRIIH